jgi:hypothetical protein
MVAQLYIHATIHCTENLKGINCIVNKVYLNQTVKGKLEVELVQSVELEKIGYIMGALNSKSPPVGNQNIPPQQVVVLFGIRITLRAGSHRSSSENVAKVTLL